MDHRKRKFGWDTCANRENEKECKSSPTPAQGTGQAPPVLPSQVSPEQLQAIYQQQQQLLLQARLVAHQKMSHVSAMQQVEQARAAAASTRIYVGSLHYDLSENDIVLAFAAFGPITKIDMPKDPATGKHKGFCFLEYHSAEAANSAQVAMDDATLAGRRIKVGRPNNITATPTAAAGASVADATTSSPAALLQAKLQAQAVASVISAQHQHSIAGQGAANAEGERRIYIGSVFYDIGEEDLRAVFGAFGTITACHLIPNPETGKHKGYGFIEYSTPGAAKGAIASMNGFELAGRKLKVGWAAAGQKQVSAAQPVGSLQAEVNQGAAAQAQDSLATEENVFIGLNQRHAIMQKLAERAGLTAGTQMLPAAIDIHLPEAGGPYSFQPTPAIKATKVLHLHNMVEPEDVDDDLRDEVKDECSKHGMVEDVTIARCNGNTSEEFSEIDIVVTFQSISEAVAAQKSLNGRWFGGKQVVASFSL